MKNDFVISPIGKIHSPLKQKFGTPRQPNLVALEAVVELFFPYNDPQAFAGIEAFSHVWLIWQFSKVSELSFRAQVRPPRLGGTSKVGVFATRSMFRPNRLGLSVVRLNKLVLKNGKAQLAVLGADLIDGTPILDIKPYVAYSDSVADAHSSFAPRPPQPKPVVWSTQAQVAYVQSSLCLQDKDIISQLIALDPRPAHEADKTEKLYKMRYKTQDIAFFWTGIHFCIADVV